MKTDFRFSTQYFRCYWTNNKQVMIQKISRSMYRISYTDGSIAKNNITKREAASLLREYIHQRV